MHAYQIVVVTLNIILVDVRNDYLSVPFIIPSCQLYYYAEKKWQNQLFCVFPTQWRKDNLNTVNISPSFQSCTVL